MIYPLCPKCGSNMIVRIARQGFNAGGEFWGCNNFPRCRWTVTVPCHAWDWYQLVPVSVRIVANQQRWINDLAADDPFLNPWIAHYESTEGLFGPYVDYDEHMWEFENAMEAAERYYDSIAEERYELEKPALQAIDQILSSTQTNSSMAGRAGAVVDRYEHSESSIQKLSAWITENFNGSRPAAFGPEDGGIDGGFVALDDRSQLMFHRTSEGILVAEWKITGRGGLSAIQGRKLLPQFERATVKLTEKQFKHIARYFSRNFGLQAPTGIPWSV